MSERVDQAVGPGTSAELRELCARATELVRGLSGPVRKLALRTGTNGVEIEWAVSGESDAGVATATSSQRPTLTVATPAAHPTAHPAAEAIPAEDKTHVVRAPLVGTFYAAPQPGADPFVVVGDIVEPGQTLGIVEAMKLMNHITAETAGRVVQILVGNAEPVEFEQPLLRIAALLGEDAA
jgi:acetyl-CoA carboxylase biotin carboxyl carrier protein